MLDSPDVETLHVLWDYDHSLVSFELDDQTTFLLQACLWDPDKIGPLVQVLVSHGADMQAGWRWNWDLLPAIQGGQKLGVMETMVNNGARMNYSAALAAVRANRADVLQLFLNKGRMREGRILDKNIEQLRDEAKHANSASLIKLVEALISARRPSGSLKEIVDRIAFWRRL